MTQADGPGGWHPPGNVGPPRPAPHPAPAPLTLPASLPAPLPIMAPPAAAANQRRSVGEWATILGGIGALITAVVAAIALVWPSDGRAAPQSGGEGAQVSARDTGSARNEESAVVTTIEGLEVVVGPMLDGSLPDAGLEPYDGYEFFTSADQSTSVRIPTAWSDREQPRWWDANDETIGETVIASTDVDGLYDGTSAPGIFIGTSALSVLDTEVFGPDFGYACTIRDRGAIQTADERGRYEVWTDCEGNGGALVKIGLTRFDQPGTIGVFIQLADARDLDALTHILQTLAID